MGSTDNGENLYNIDIKLKKGDNEFLIDAYSDFWGGFIGAIVKLGSPRALVYSLTDPTWEVTPSSNSRILKDIMTILGGKRLFVGYR